jgi:hypothetical protein
LLRAAPSGAPLSFLVESVGFKAAARAEEAAYRRRPEETTKTPHGRWEKDAQAHLRRKRADRAGLDPESGCVIGQFDHHVQRTSLTKRVMIDLDIG